jgi:hypothetical protein
VWDDLHNIDPEKRIHNVELYKVWLEKVEFVRKGIEKNPYGHEDFLWVDAGICRKESLKRIIPDFPDASRIPIDRIMVSNVMPFTKSDRKIITVNGIEFTGGITGKDRIGGGIISGRKGIWEKYFTLFNTTKEKYRKAGGFWGKEQDLMRTMVLEEGSLFSLVEVKPIIQLKWEYQLIYLGSKKSVYSRMIDDKLNREAKSNEELERLGSGLW